mmetsp:Transcript_32848/g.29710  ORF Transcript_32848/g.29710 Transcript_32848/m.29710 type:complete len:430 (+) Transcript_32848:489-1778(+)
MLDLAKASKNLDNMVHVSTCYVNSDKLGMIEEKIYEIDRDPERLINDLYKIPVDQLEKETPHILGKFPNTYTFTKSMAERIIDKRRGNTPVTLVRPSIVGASWREPTIGWIDTISAASAVYFFTGLGIMHAAEGNEGNIGDQVPVDYVSDITITAAAAYANKNEKTHVINCSSSSRNPVKWRQALQWTTQYFQKQPSSKGVSRPHLIVFKNKKHYHAYSALLGLKPKMYKKVAQLMGNKTMQKNADKLIQVGEKSKIVSSLFVHFSMNEWIFNSQKIEEIAEFCTEDERKRFFIDIKEVDWKKYFTYFAWGIHRFALKESPDYPTNEPTNMNILERSRNYFEDIKWTISKGFNFKPRPKSQMKSLIVNSPRIQNVITSLTEARKSKNVSTEAYKAQLNQQANQLCESIFSTYSMRTIKVAAFVINKIVR